mgnify:FL=1
MAGSAPESKGLSVRSDLVPNPRAKHETCEPTALDLDLDLDLRIDSRPTPSTKDPNCYTDDGLSRVPSESPYISPGTRAWFMRDDATVCVSIDPDSLARRRAKTFDCDVRIIVCPSNDKTLCQCTSAWFKRSERWSWICTRRYSYS